MQYSFRHLLCRTSAATALLALAAAGSVYCQTAAAQPSPAPQQAQQLQVDLRTRRVEQIARGDLHGVSFKTSANETLEVLLPDGASIVLASNSALEISEFTYNKQTGAGSLKVNLASGAVRIMTGKATLSQPAQISVAGVNVALGNGGAFVAGDGANARVALLAGGPANVGCKTPQSITRVGFQVDMKSGACVGSPRRQDGAEAFADAVRVNPGLVTTSGRELAAANAGDRIDDRETLEIAPTPDYRFTFDTRAGTAGGGITFGGPVTGGALAAQSTNQTGNFPFVNLLTTARQAVELNTVPSTVFQRRLPLTSPFDYRLASGSAPTLVGGANLQLSLLTQTYPDLDQGLFDSFSLCADNASNTACDPDLDPLQDPLPRPAEFLAEKAALTEYLNYLTDTPNWLLIVDPAATVQFLNADATAADSKAAFQTLFRIPKSALQGPAATEGRLQQITTGSAIAFGSQVRVHATDSDILLPKLTETKNIPVRLLRANASTLSGPHFLALEWADAANTYSVAHGAIGTSRATAAGLIDTFNLTRGLTAGDFSNGIPRAGDPGFRAFLPGGDTFGGATYYSTPLWIANGAGLADNALLQADFAISANGDTSSASATFGQLTYGGTTASITARTVGSQRTAGAGSTLLQSPVFASAVGGGNPDLTRAGAVGYLVLENISTSSSTGGTSDPVGAAASTGFAYERIASAVSSQARATTTPSTTRGFVAGLLERENTSGAPTVLPFASSLDLVTNPTTNTATVTLAGDVSMSLGGAGASALIDSQRYAAGGANSKSALISGPTIYTGLQAHSGAAKAFEKSTAGSYQYLQWGFFFGDILGSPQTHTDLASWVTAQAIVDASGYRHAGTASYSGHAIGNVLDNGVARLGLGTFDQTWNLGSGDGTMKLNFDNRTLTNAPGLALQSGGLGYSGFLTDTTSITGRFSGTLAAGDSAGNANASIGQFQIQTPGGYSAVGTFGGVRVSP